MKQLKSTGNIGVDYAFAQSKAIQKCMHLDAEMAYGSLPKQETLELAAKEFSNNSAVNNYEHGINVGKYQGFIEGAKWQQERTYSEEEVYDILIHHTVELFKKEPITLESFWNKFKNK